MIQISMAVASVKEEQQDQTFLVFKVLFHLSPPWASQLAQEGGKECYLSSAYEDRQSLGKRLMATEQTRTEAIPEKLHSTHTAFLHVEAPTVCARLTCSCTL